MLNTSLFIGRRFLLYVTFLLCSLNVVFSQIIIRDSSDPLLDGLYWNFGFVNGRNFYQKFNGSSNDYGIMWTGSKWVIQDLTSLNVYYSNVQDTQEPPCNYWEVIQTGYTPILMTGTVCTKVFQVADSDEASINGFYHATGTLNGRELFVNSVSGARIQWTPSLSSTDAWELQWNGNTYYKNTVDIELPPCANIGTWNPELGNDPILLKGDCAQFLPNQIQVSGNGTQIYYGVYNRVLTGTVQGRVVYENNAILFVGEQTLAWNSTAGEWQLSLGSGNVLHRNASNDPEPPCQGWTDLVAQSITYTINLTGNCYISAVAPVTWGTWEVETNGTAVELFWETLNEENNQGFIVQRAKADPSFPLREMNWEWEDRTFLTGAGNSLTPRQYTYKDSLSEPGTYLYRIMQLDFDGKTSFSSLQEVIFETERRGLQLAPNPAQKVLQLRASSTLPRQVAIISSAGQVFTRTLSPQGELDISSLTTGMYTLKIHQEGHISFLRFFKK